MCGCEGEDEGPSVALQTDAVLFAVVTVWLLAAWWWLFFLPFLSRVIRFPSQLAAALLRRREGCREEEEEAAALSNELFPSQPHLPPPLPPPAAVAPHHLTSGPHADGAECRSSCWMRRPREEVVTAM